MEIIIKHKKELRYGNKGEGKFIPAEKGRRAIFVPSLGTMETAEIDEVVQAAQEKEDTRIKKGYKTEQKEQLEQITQAVRQAPPGERAKMARELLRGGSRWI